MLVDGGFTSLHDVQDAADRDVTVYGPVPTPRKAERHRYLPLKGDSEAIAALRTRMGTDEAKAIYKDRAATAECVNAQARNRGLLRLPERGLDKVEAVVLLLSLAHNFARLWALPASSMT